MWLGTMITQFTDHELRLLRDLGFLTPHEIDLLSQSGRRLDGKG